MGIVGSDDPDIVFPGKADELHLLDRQSHQHKINIIIYQKDGATI